MAESGEVRGQIARSTQPPTTLSYEAYAKFVNRAVEAFGNEEQANHWLTTPQPWFDNQIPLRMAEQDGFSMEKFEDLFLRIEHGIYS